MLLTEGEYRGLCSLIDPDDLGSMQLSRRDSLDNEYVSGVLVASVVPKIGKGEHFRVAIGDTSVAPWEWNNKCVYCGQNCDGNCDEAQAGGFQ